MKAEAAIQADTRCSVRDPRNTTDTEPKMKSSVVAALTVESTTLYHPSMLQPS
jgi:hypothetical protein